MNIHRPILVTAERAGSDRTRSQGQASWRAPFASLRAAWFRPDGRLHTLPYQESATDLRLQSTPLTEAGKSDGFSWRLPQCLQLVENLPAFILLALVHQRLAQQIGRRVVARIQPQRAAQDSFRIRIIGSFEIALAEQYVRTAEIGVQPDGALQVRDCGGPLLLARIVVPQPVPCHGEARIHGELLLQLADSFFQLAPVDGYLPQQETRPG